MHKRILITGSSGMVGTLLIEKFKLQGIKVSILSRNEQSRSDVSVFLWDVEKNKIDPHCLDDVDCIVHLAGASIGEKRWTEKQKKIILESRLKSTTLLYDLLSNSKHQVSHFICASAIGFYGNSGNIILKEDMSPGQDFLAEVCKLWEREASKIRLLGIATSILRFGIILHSKKGSLRIMAKPVDYYIGSALGSGNQWISWIHHLDLIAFIYFLYANPQISETYNLAAPGPVTNKIFFKTLGKVKNKPLWPINVPSFVLKLVLGEMSALVLNSNKASADKVLKTGFEFRFNELEPALNDIYSI